MRGLCAVAVASSSPDSQNRAKLILPALRDLIPYDCALIAGWDPVGGCHRTIANEGYPDHIVEHLCSSNFVSELKEFGAVSGPTRAMRVRDLPCEPDDLPTFGKVLAPEGFTEDMTACLHDDQQHYVGMLNLSTSGATAPPSDTAREIVDLISEALVNAIDRSHLHRRVIETMQLGQTAVMLGVSGKPVSVLEKPGDEALVALLDEESDVIKDTRRLLEAGALPARFLWRRPGSSGWRPVRVLAADEGEEDRRALAVVGPATEAYSLTAREVQVLSLLARGWSNRTIAEHLVVAPRTVATHIEHTFKKLDEHNRAGAVARALKEGLLFAFPEEGNGALRSGEEWE